MIFVSLNIRAFWKVTHSKKYHKNVSSYDDTIHLVSNITEEAGRKVVITHKLRDIIEKKERATVEYSICNRNTVLEIMKNANQKLFAVGIEIVDIEARAKILD